VAGSREFSAGGVVVRPAEGRYEVAVIRPAGRSAVALPKGHIDPGETAEVAAIREVLEETGLSVDLVRGLGEISYVYRFHHRSIFKVVRFFLCRWVRGDIGAITEAMHKEVHSAWWIPLSDAPTRLSYPGERRMAAKALAVLSGPPPSTQP
jgi:8-oxo-dGTP pyrophosphatase MutT (NUDIX family)